VRFISVVGLLLTSLAFIGLFIGSASIGTVASHNGYTRTTGMAPLLTAIVIMAIQIYPLIKLSAYASAIRRLRNSGSIADLNFALEQQRAFWKFVGFLMLIAIILWVALFVIGMSGAFVMARGR
jgi:hypothetical protein